MTVKYVLTLSHDAAAGLLRELIRDHQYETKDIGHCFLDGYTLTRLDESTEVVIESTPDISDLIRRIEALEGPTVSPSVKWGSTERHKTGDIVTYNGQSYVVTSPCIPALFHSDGGLDAFEGHVGCLKAL